MVGKSYWLALFFILAIAASQARFVNPQVNFSEINKVAKGKSVKAETWAEINHILRTSFGETNRNKNPAISPKSIRVTDWNIERGLELAKIKILFNGSPSLESISSNEALQQIQQQINTIKQTDIFVLNEVDWGLPRTQYRNIAKDFADLINANYVFVPEFLELSPDILEDPNLERDKYLGLHGNAIISRFPISNSSVLRLPHCYDWYTEELKKLGLLEKTRRKSSDLVVNEQIISELREGGRVALISDIELPNEQTITVIATHLENRTKAACRERQLETILKHIKSIKNPVVFAGDLNNFEKSAEPLYLQRALADKAKDTGFWARLGLNFINPYNLITNASRFVVDSFRKHRDPTVADVPILLPNKARKLFKMIEEFRFDDELAFDLSGNEQWSFESKASSGRYSNSNQIANKGFVETFSFKRHLGIAKYKIDWIFVKPSLRAGCKTKEEISYDCKKYFPAFGQTLKELNQYFGISDHHPVTVEVIL